MRHLAVLVPVLLVAYALFDKAFAWLHVPGTPLFVGEAVLAVGAVMLICATQLVRPFVAVSVVGWLLLLVAWGFFRTVPGLPWHGFSALRDASLWYYILFVFFILALRAVLPQLALSTSSVYGRMVLPILVWSPFALVLGRLDGQGWGPHVPDSTTPLFAHRPANIAVHAALALAFLWLVPGQRPLPRIAMTSLALGVILAAGTQTRGGLVAASIAILLTIVFCRQRQRLLSVAAGILGALILVLAVTEIPLGSGRELSLAQLSANVASITGGSEGVHDGGLEVTVEWRQDLWAGVVEHVVESDGVLFGTGFGTNLAVAAGRAFNGDEGAFLAGGEGTLASPDLRTPHNSHLHVFARMGSVGLVMWVAAFASLFAGLARSRRVFRTRNDGVRQGITEVLMAVIPALLFNAYFDPTLELPAVAAWLWVLVGVGAVMVWDARAATDTAAEGTDATGSSLTASRSS